MHKTIVFLLGLLVSASALAVRDGDSLAAVLAEKGKPTSKLEHGNVTVLTYGDTVIRLENGVVVAVTTPTPDYAGRALAVKPIQRTAGGSGSGAGTGGEWTTDHAAAVAAAQGTGRKVLLLFTGTDWCSWCKRLEGEILDTPEFKDYAREHLVLVKLDFPRRLPQSEELKAQNRRLQQQYGIEGYPTVVVLNDSGAETGRVGYVRGGPGAFLPQLR